jgi:predicted metal-dependent hydrolase
MALLDLVEMNRKHAHRRLMKTADDLRQLVEQVERNAADLDRVGQTRGPRSHTVVVGRALHDVTTFLANMHLESAFEYAAEADSAMAEAKATAQLDGQRQ